jgi:hypothetical protein
MRVHSIALLLFEVEFQVPDIIQATTVYVRTLDSSLVVRYEVLRTLLTS